MGSKVTGRAAVFGFGASSTVSWTGVGTLLKESADITHQYQLDRLHDDDNELVSLAHSGESYKGVLIFTPVAASGTNTLANAKESLLPPVKGSQVTLASWAEPASPGVHGINKADWVYVGNWKRIGKRGGFWVYQLEIERSPNNDISTQPS